ncbi:hypothetical protein SAMN06265365_12419 [Tistlia consotensis]|uniref:Tetratricopeptide repeat-containing protein n=1 Tax=Tistlia consotensis USBA 355 TaxID=560819 RepID=A0A1Y6CRJ8_9PROT|nr:hypothetical protein [Tistlia consotensis]SMF68050.1 hypothetical protein SAMN05428998_12786 [Tistlia consotensis USBA 355]SNR99086.1 hypothetical protein SAMN06265365_12419 [Tistlia consotensis]
MTVRAAILRLLLALALLLPVLATRAATGAAAQDAASVTAERAPAYDRVVVGFARPNPTQVDFEGRDLVFRFAEPAALTLGPLAEVLTDLRGKPRIEDDGRRLVLPFAERRALTQFQLGTRLVVDLGRDGKAPPPTRPMPGAAELAGAAPAPPGGKGGAAAPPPAAPPDTAAKAEPAAAAEPKPIGGLAVLLRVGVHDDYDRLVFDWPKTVGFRVEEAGIGTTRIRFSVPGRLDASALADTRVRRLSQLTAVNAVDGLTVELSYAPGVNAHAFSLDRRIVVDLAGKKGPLRLARVKLTEQPDPAAAAAEAARAAKVSGKGPVALFPQGKDAAKPSQPPPPKPDAAAPAAPPSPVAERGPAHPPPPPDIRNKTPAGFQIERTDAFGRQIDTPLPGGTAPWPEPVVLRFDWPLQTRGALLQTGSSVLLVFDRTAPDWATHKLETLAPELKKLDRYDLKQGSAFTFEVSALVSALLHRDGKSWILDLRPRPGLLDQPLPLIADPEHQSLQVATEDAGTPIALRDPVTGSRIFAVPLGEDAGFSPGRRFPQVEILPSVQGLFVGPLSDRVSVGATTRRVTISGLATTGLAEAAAAKDAPPTAESGRRLFDPKAWRQEQRGDYSAVRQDLQTAVATARTGAELTAARLALARFYFGHGFAQETLGLLDLMFTDNPGLKRDPELLLMAGASQTLAGDYADAVKTLGDPALVGEPEARLWQGLLAAAAQDWPVAAERLDDGFPLVADYARAVRVRFGLAAAEARLQSADTAGAAEYLKKVEPDLQTALEHAHFDLVQGMTRLANDEPAKADKLLKKVAEGGFGSASARARLLLIERAMADGSMNRAQAIDEIEKLRFAWRGDAFEFALLMRLADLYEAQGDDRQALRSLRSAASNFPGHPGAEAAAIRMQTLFTELFTGARAKTLAPLTALSIYDEFKELTPPGPKGDAIIAALADRLVDIDLLDRAAELLDEQVAHRLTGLERCRVGARLALVQLLDRQPAKAIAALDASAMTAPPAELHLQRERLRAKALIDLDQGETALQVLKGDDSEEADRLRVEVDRKAGRWSDVATILGSRLPPADKPLDEDGAARVVNAAVANVLSGQKAQLKSLAKSYTGVIAKTSYAETFALLAGDGGERMLASISDQLSQVEQAQGFMTDYKNRLAKDPLSALN